MTLQRRQGVEFDPSKLEHRIAVGHFLKRQSWADAGIQFAHDPKYGSMVEQVRTKLLNWYLAQEMPETVTE